MSAKKQEKVTLYEEELYESKEPKEETARFVVFRLSQEWYAIEIGKVREVVKVENITYLPFGPEHIVGIANLRGNILAVMELKKAFGLAEEPLTDKSRLIVVERNTFEAGILCDNVLEVAEVALKNIEPILATVDSVRAEYVTGQCHINNKLVGVLNVEKILEKGR